MFHFAQVSVDQGRVLTGTRPTIISRLIFAFRWGQKCGVPVILKPTLLRATAVSLGLLMSSAAAMGAWAEEKTPAPKAGVEKAAVEKVAEKPTDKLRVEKTSETKPVAPKPAADKPAAKPAAKKSAAKKAPPKVEIYAERLDEISAEQNISQTVVDLAGWVIAADDNRDMPFAIVDKLAGQVLLFGVDGKLKGMAPVLLGSAHGDYSAEGVGDRELKDIPMEDRTTPAGRFLAGYGPAYGGETVLWVDYATAISIHPIPATKVSKAEKRTQRINSAKVDDNFITHGCINASPTFYNKVVKPLFKEGGVFYVLPDTITLAEAFPSFGADIQAQIAAADAGDVVAAR